MIEKGLQGGLGTIVKFIIKLLIIIKNAGKY